MPKVGDRVRFWTMEECREYYKNTYQPKEATVPWGEIVTVLEVFDGDACTVRFSDASERTVGPNTIKEDDEYRLACATLGEDYFA